MIYKKIIITLILFAGLIFDPSHVFASSATLSLSPATGTFNQGCSFSIDVILDTGGQATDGTDAVINYDPTRFQAVSITNGTIYSDYPGQKIDSTNGQISISGLASPGSSGYTGTGTLATINFTVLPSAPTGLTQMTILYDPSKTNESNVVLHGSDTSILGQVNNGSYTVGTSACGTTGSSLSPTLESKIPPPIGGSTDLGGKTPPPYVTLAKSGDDKATIFLGVLGGGLTVLGILGLTFI